MEAKKLTHAQVNRMEDLQYINERIEQGLELLTEGLNIMASHSGLDEAFNRLENAIRDGQGSMALVKSAEHGLRHLQMDYEHDNQIDYFNEKIAVARQIRADKKAKN